MSLSSSESLASMWLHVFDLFPIAIAPMSIAILCAP